MEFIVFLLGISMTIFSDKLVDFNWRFIELIARDFEKDVKEPYILPLVISIKLRTRKYLIWAGRAFGILFMVMAVVM